MVLDSCDRSTSFEGGWKLTQDQFLTLREIFSRLATAFSDTSTVESDFSVVKRENRNSSVSLTDLSLESILYAPAIPANLSHPV